MPENRDYDGLPEKGNATRLFVTIIIISCVIYVPIAAALLVCHDEEAKQLEAQGAAYLRNQQYQESIEVWNKMLDRDSRSLQARIGLGIAYTQMGKYSEAERHFNHSIRMYPDSTKAVFNRALLYLHRGDRSKAEQELKHILELDRYYPEARYHIGFIAEQKGNYLKAKEMYIEELNVNPASAKTWYRLEMLRENNVIPSAR